MTAVNPTATKEGDVRIGDQLVHGEAVHVVYDIIATNWRTIFVLDREGGPMLEVTKGEAVQLLAL